MHIEVIDDDMARILREKTGAQRLQMANDMFESARKMITHHLRSENPQWDEKRIQLETARRLSHGAV